LIGIPRAPCDPVSEQSEALKARTMKFALDVCTLLRDLPRDEPGPTVKRQLAKASTGTAFNYRASCRARSHAEFTARIGIVAEEIDETQGWLEFVLAARLLSSTTSAKRLHAESGELCAIFSAQAGTARAKENAVRNSKHESAGR
jgi:four helix bundle protein